jgi:hypothetical protein
MVYFDPRQNFGSTSSLFSGYTISLPGRVFGEQRGGVAEILSKIKVDHRYRSPHLTSTGVTYLYLVECLGIVEFLCNAFYITSWYDNTTRNQPFANTYIWLQYGYFGCIWNQLHRSEVVDKWLQLERCNSLRQP